MFTGLVEKLADVETITMEGPGKKLGVIASDWTDDVQIGDSIAINGTCLTVIQKTTTTLFFQAGPETLQKTNLGELQRGDGVNLERALRVGDRLGGHFVQGHVDGIGKVRERNRDGDWETFWFTCPTQLTTQMVPKGSIAVDGISLTLVDVTSDGFSVALIPHTLEMTTLGKKSVGSTVNLETDLLAKYVSKSITGTGVTMDALQKAGFINS